MDARSRQPELKHAAVRVEKAGFGWHLLAARRMEQASLREMLVPPPNGISTASAVPNPFVMR